MSTPKIVFVDGPNGSGKDYFISNLIKHYKKNNPYKNVETMHLSEYTRSVRDLTGSRFSDKTNTLVFLRHLNALTDLKKLADDLRVHLVVVNRSFSSFLSYNVPIVKQDQEEDTGMLSFVRKFFLHEADCNNPDYDTNEPSVQEKERQEFLTTYMNVFNGILGDVKTCYVSLGAYGYSLEDQAERIQKRIIDRDQSSNTAVTTKKLQEVIQAYDSLEEDYLHMYSVTTTKTFSGEYEAFYKNYLQWCSYP